MAGRALLAGYHRYVGTLSLCKYPGATSIIDSSEYCRYYCSHGSVSADSSSCSSTHQGAAFILICMWQGLADSSEQFYIANGIGEHCLKHTHGFTNLFAKTPLLWSAFICSTGLFTDVHFMNALIPDRTDAGGEQHSLSMKYIRMYFDCNDLQDVPWIPGHPKRVEINHLCVRDHRNFGHVSFYRKGTHLMNCRYMKSTSMFKWPGSRCIPLRKVVTENGCCNGKDGNNCLNDICPATSRSGRVRSAFSQLKYRQMF